MASHVREVLGRLTGVPSVIAAILMKPDGSMIERSMSNGVDPETVQVRVRDMLSDWEWAGSELGMGKPHGFLLETGNGPLSMVPVGPDTVLVTMGSRSCRIGVIRRQMQRAKEAICAAECSAESAIPDLQWILAEIPSGVREHTSREEVAGGPAEGSAGEVVVIGVTTFRLARRLVAAVSQVQGVRSATLRAYSPGSLTIDIAFQGGGTLAVITGRCFGECSLDIIERTATRLVLGISSQVASAAALLGRAP